MKVCAISDIHGILIDIEPCDLVLICGDISPLSYQGSTPLMEEWLKYEFANWVNQLPCEQVIFIAGNHDCVFAGKTKSWIYENVTIPTKGKAVYLENNSHGYIDDEGNFYRIYGTPACKIFGNWAFNYSDDELERIYSNIPEDCDILIAHDAPYGVTDICLQNKYQEHLGNIPLREAIENRHIDYVLHGHLHSSSHKFEILGDSKIANCSIVNEHYYVAYPPIVIHV